MHLAKIQTLFILLFISNCISAQQSIVGGIINSYTPVLSFTPCENKITVEDASSFNTGDTVMMIQMKGAVIDSTNTSVFGNITNYKNAGNYEFNYIKSKSENIIELKNLLIRQYDIPNGKVQLIKVPYYQNVNIASTLTCLPWDGSKGGVLVLNAQDTVNLNANIDVSGKGFYGGQIVNSKSFTLTCHENDYYYVNNDMKASAKGEGIATVSAQRSFGRGAMANGGGGGVGHNSGGGGGGNIADGGKGGKEWFNCGAPLDNGGIGGKSLQYNTIANKIFLGGGGGAGHCDNIPGFNPNGGNGGGIIIIQSNFIKVNSNKVISDGSGAIECIRNSSTPGMCHEGMGGGGAGGTILLKSNLFLDNLVVSVNGGKGADMNGETQLQLGPGGGGSGGVVWISTPALPFNVSVLNNGGINGVNIDFGNDSYGATPGTVGSNVFNLAIPVATIPFKTNIDSVRFNNIAPECTGLNFNFNGLAYTNTNPISTWQWAFGDGNTASTQNASNNYTANGTYTVKIVAADINGCKDSISRMITAGSGTLDFDFNYKVDVCNPLSVQFTGVGTDTQNPYWSFGDAATVTGDINPVHVYTTSGNYVIKYNITKGACTDTITKTINLAINKEDIILTNDTTICSGNTKQLRTKTSLSFCWNPTTYLDDSNSANPITSTPQNITYFYTAEISGTNIIANGNFNAGNTGFTSAYNYATPNVTEGQYFVGASPQAWNASLNNCTDHTTGTGNMMLVNGSPAPDIKVWSQIVTVTPNTNYVFSTWIQALWPPNPAQLQFSINDNDIGTLITASLPTCTWTQFYTTWNSGNNTTASISIINKNTQILGNDFALDDIAFAPVLIKRDSVIIKVETPVVTATNSTAICESTFIQLNAAGAATYNWSPTATLSNPNIANPIATPVTNTRYIVAGTTIAGCIAKDTVDITIKPKPLITKSNNDTICASTYTQLFADGGITYNWSPTTSLNNTSIQNPVASPLNTTTYYVTVTGANNCSNTDSIKISVRSVNSFTINSPVDICKKNTVQLTANGGQIYSWQPAISLDNAVISNPNASPTTTTLYSVQIKDTLCGNTATLSTTVTVLPLPFIIANKSNDIDCSTSKSQLNATGGVKYLWSPLTTLNNATIRNPLATPFVTTQYIVKGTDLSGCENSDSVTVNVTNANKGGYLMPSAFTPNNDGKNDCYGIKYWGVIEEIDFNIYNRWGERIFHTTTVGDCWNGIYKGLPQDPAVFIYVIRAKTTCENSVFRKGTFALIR